MLDEIEQGEPDHVKAGADTLLESLTRVLFEASFRLRIVPVFAHTDPPWLNR
jgi:hypothetical protein